ncbi:MAG: leucine-rich repeat protein [Prevotella sp.]|nr:leucine-rich repeat protein [Prevotella sp.]MBQ5579211.1 leucine-rich repeat protein [Prevotella sp.]MBR6936230.1 leucine-rich repeat protein [Prevotella sp.]
MTIEMKQNVKKYVFLAFALVCAISVNAANKSLETPSEDDTFQASIPLGKSTVEATFTITDRTNNEVMIGYDNYYYEADIYSPTLPSTDSHVVEGKYFTAIDKATEGRLTIPETVTDENGVTYTVTGIANHAFAECSGLTFISVPKTIKDIDTFAFSQCTGLKILKVCVNEPLEVFASTFEGIEDATLYVRRGCLEAYSAAKCWKDFSLIREFPNGDVNLDGEVNIQDVVATVGHMLGNETEPFEESFADMNEDGTINITDVTAIVSLILNQE